jgi:hypothetical protein
MTTTHEYTAEQWPYAGLRIDGGPNSGTKPMHAWYDPADAKVRYWMAGRERYAVGSVYTMLISRESDGLYSSGKPQFNAAEPWTDTEQLVEWEIANDAAQARLERTAAERKVKQQGGRIDAACKPLEELAAHVATFTELEQLIAAVRQRIFAAWDSK